MGEASLHFAQSLADKITIEIRGNGESLRKKKMNGLGKRTDRRGFAHAFIEHERRSRRSLDFKCTLAGQRRRETTGN